MIWIFVSLFLLSLLTSFLFLISLNPFSLGIILICQTILLSLLISPFIKSFWFFYLLMLIFIGGMLVLFLYVTSIFPNEKFLFKQNLLFILVLSSISFMMMLFYNNFSIYAINLDLLMNFNPSEYLFMKSNINMYTSPSNLIFILLVNYLFYCMIVIIKIINFFKGPLRMMNYV